MEPLTGGKGRIHRHKYVVNSLMFHFKVDDTVDVIVGRRIDQHKHLESCQRPIQDRCKLPPHKALKVKFPVQGIFSPVDVNSRRACEEEQETTRGPVFYSGVHLYNCINYQHLVVALFMQISINSSVPEFGRKCTLALYKLSAQCVQQKQTLPVHIPVILPRRAIQLSWLRSSWKVSTIYSILKYITVCVSVQLTIYCPYFLLRLNNVKDQFNMT